MKENEGKFSFTKKIPKNLKEIREIAEEKRKKSEESIKQAFKDDTLLSSDEEVSGEEKKEKEETVEDILKEAKAIPDDESGPEEMVYNDDQEQFDDETFQEKQILNKKTKGFWIC